MAFRRLQLSPEIDITPAAQAQGRRAMVQDAAWANLVGALYGGVILVGFALELGASPFVIGLLAAIPFFSQLAQLPAVLAIERLRERRRLAVPAVLAARLIIFSLALLPWLLDGPAVLAAVLATQVAITLLGAVAGCAINSWFHQFLAGQDLGRLYAQRLFWSMVASSLGALTAGHVVQHWPFADRLHAYSLNFAAAGLAGFIGLHFLARVPEPPMARTGPPRPILSLLRAPLLEPNFRRLIVFMASWNFASNLAAPFLTVYLLSQLGYGLGTVTALWAGSQLANAFTLYAWGQLSDRLSNKAILATALPAYFGCLIALPVTALPEPHVLTVPLLALIHVVMGIASGGIGLASGNIGLKLAPQGSGTAYLAAVSLAGSVAAGAAALAGGALAEWFAARELAFVLQWRSPGHSAELVALQFRHWEFLFAIAFALGLYVMHALSRVSEGAEVSEREVMRNFILEAGRMLEVLSSTAATSVGTLFPFGRLFDRRGRPRGNDACTNIPR
jgi:MFS family permease